jgi:sulfite reductase (NADPH) flavoprotein alpha-component
VDTLRSTVAAYDREQLLWSSGYLAGLAAGPTALQQPATKQLLATDSRWFVFYATETGNSRHIAGTLADRARQVGLAVELHDLRDYRPRALAKVDNALFVIATHGIGEAPDSSELFFEYWLAERAPRLQKLNYSVLALGDSSYADYCEMGRLFDQRLRDLGANRIVDRVDCDLDFETPAAEWTDRVLDYVSNSSDAPAAPSTLHVRAVPDAPILSHDFPYDAEVLANQKITGNGSSKDVRHVELSLEGSGLEYHPGDSLGVIPQNPSELVNELLDILRLDGGQEVTVGDETVALAKALIVKKEITVLHRPFLDAVAREHPRLKLIVDNRNKLAAFLKSRQIIDVIIEYRKAWRAQEFVDALRKLNPRLYSISSGPDTNPNEAHLTVAVVRYEQFGRSHWGAASNYLASGVLNVPVYLEPNENFRLPAEGDTPIIMIGAGTGIAPYRAFVEHRREHGQRGDNWLVFGDRNLATDFLYQIEWLRYRKDGTLNRLDVAFSRDRQHKVYVQHRIIEQAKRLFSWLERGAHVYVCGDADRMAGDVNDALLTVLQSAGGLTRERAAEYLSELKSSRRYQRDVY